MCYLFLQTNKYAIQTILPLIHLAVSSGTSLALSAVFAVLLFSAMQMNRPFFAATQLNTILGGFFGSWVFVFSLTVGLFCIFNCTHLKNNIFSYISRLSPTLRLSSSAADSKRSFFRKFSFVCLVQLLPAVSFIAFALQHGIYNSFVWNIVNVANIFIILFAFIKSDVFDTGIVLRQQSVSKGTNCDASRRFVCRQKEAKVGGNRIFSMFFFTLCCGLFSIKHYKQYASCMISRINYRKSLKIYILINFTYNNFLPFCLFRY